MSGTFALYSLLCRSAQLGTPKDAFIAMDVDLDRLSSGSQTDVGGGKLRRSMVSWICDRMNKPISMIFTLARLPCRSKPF